MKKTYLKPCVEEFLYTQVEVLLGSDPVANLKDGDYGVTGDGFLDL